MTNPDREELVKLADLRSANVARQKEWDAGNQLTLAYRGNELAGEVGEACNVIKKLERERLGLAGSRDTVAHLAEELADVVICADLIAMHEGIDLLGEAVPAKFNATSEKVGLKTRYEPALRRLASSEDAVKGEPEPVSNSNFRSLVDLAAFGKNYAGGHFEVEIVAQVERLRQAEEERQAELRESFTAPPADVGMRPTAEDVLKRISTELGVMAESLTDGPSGFADGVFATIFAGTVWANMSTDIEAITTPRATTKFDGASRPCTCHPDDKPPEPCPQKFALSECVEATKPSDPSSTRSEVTVDIRSGVLSAIRSIYGIGFGTFAGGYQNDSIERAADKIVALLDQFEIRRK